MHEKVIWSVSVYLLCHLQRLINISGQDGQEIIDAAHKKSTLKKWVHKTAEHLVWYKVNNFEAKHHPPFLTFNLWSDAVLGPVSGQNHCCQVSPCRVATKVKTSENKKKPEQISQTSIWIKAAHSQSRRSLQREKCYLMWEYCWTTDTTLLRTCDTIRSMLP